MKGIENGRAQAAYQAVTKIENEKFATYRSHIKTIPMFVQNNGLAQTLVFCQSKKDWYLIYSHLEAWLLNEQQQILFGLNNEKNLTEVITKVDSDTYRLMTMEALRYIEWLRRFVDGQREKL